MSKCKAILYVAAAMMLSLPTVSCRSSRDYTTHGYRPYHERRNRGGIDPNTEPASADNGKQQRYKKGGQAVGPYVDEAWANLRVKLTRQDNKALYDELRRWLGTPYLYGGQTRGVGSDCSGLVVEVYKKVYDVRLERNSAKMLERNCERIDPEELKEGDLVFFVNGGGRISHVGIYLKEDKFVHASSSRGVVVDDMRQNYYNTHFYAAGRVKSL